MSSPDFILSLPRPVLCIIMYTMLRQLRHKKVMKRVLWVLAAIIIPAFVLLGSGSLGERRNYAGIIFGKKVSMNEYSSAWEAVKNEALMSYGSKFYEIAGQLDLYNQAWERLIMLREAGRKNIKVSDSEVISFISRVPFFLGKNGSFDQRRYDIILANTFRRPARRFEEDMRDSLMITKLVQSMFKDIAVSDEEVEKTLEERMETEEATQQREGVPPSDSKGGEKKDEKEETPQEKKEKIRNLLLMKKRIGALQSWRNELFERAALVDNVKKPEPEEEGPQEETPPEIPQEDLAK